MRKFFSGVKFKIIVSICAALLLGVVIAAVSDGGASPVSAGLSYVLTPLNRISMQLKEKLSDFGAGFRSAAYYKAEAESLRTELRADREQLVELEKLRHKLAAYEEFLEVKSDHPDYVFIPASVILRDSADIYATYTLNCGSGDGVEINDPVISGGNLVGVVKAVTEKTATVYSVLHPSVNVSAYEIRTREDCFTEPQAGLSSQGKIRVSGLSRSSPVAVGGVVCTSGIGGVFPRDLIIGTVTELVNSESDVSAYAVITPDVDPHTLVDVFVITSFNGQTEQPHE